MDWTTDVPEKRLINFCLDWKSDKRVSDTVTNVEMYVFSEQFLFGWPEFHHKNDPKRQIIECHFNRCREYLDGFEETGYCVGNLHVSLKGNEPDVNDEPEQELHLRGNFLRIRHPDPSSRNSLRLSGFTHNFIYSKKGHLVQLSTLKFNNGKDLIFGSFLSTPGFKDPIESILNDRETEASLDDVLYAPNLKFSTCELRQIELRRLFRNNCLVSICRGSKLNFDRVSQLNYRTSF